MEGLFLIFVFGAVFNTVSTIQCKLCWPPVSGDDCDENEANIDCRQWKDMGYDSCIEVVYHGNQTVARTCYPSYKCEGAKEWCSRYGPCTVTCCKYNLCNDGHDLDEDEHTSSCQNRFSSLLILLPAVMALLLSYM